MYIRAQASNGTSCSRTSLRCFITTGVLQSLAWIIGTNHTTLIGSPSSTIIVCRLSATLATFVLPLDHVSRLGFGCYRTDINVPAHGEALRYAIARGCTLIDTASTYCDGR